MREALRRKSSGGKARLETLRGVLALVHLTFKDCVILLSVLRISQKTDLGYSGKYRNVYTVQYMIFWMKHFVLFGLLLSPV